MSFTQKFIKTQRNNFMNLKRINLEFRKNKHLNDAQGNTNIRPIDIIEAIQDKEAEFNIRLKP